MSDKVLVHSSSEDMALGAALARKVLGMVLARTALNRELHTAASSQFLLPDLERPFETKGSQQQARAPC